MRSSFLGNYVHVEAKLENGEIILAELSRLNGTVAPGDQVHLWWEPTDELRFP